jgi:2,3-bisphosphoglycerate-dependent phosphoglycerate mutase
MRHGESTANLDGTYAGWSDVSLTSAGIEQARAAGRLLKEEGLEFDLCFTSVLRRATHTVWHCLDAMDRTWLPVRTSWRLNERHYGALQGLDKAGTEATFGPQQVRSWRRGYTTRPPAAAPEARRASLADPRYATLDPADVPCSESMHDTVVRLRPLWEEAIAPGILRGERVLVVAHGTSLRALMKLLSDLREEEIEQVEIPNGVPTVYELDGSLRVVGVRPLEVSTYRNAAAHAGGGQPYSPNEAPRAPEQSLPPRHRSRTLR